MNNEGDIRKCEMCGEDFELERNYPKNQKRFWCDVCEYWHKEEVREKQEDNNYKMVYDSNRQKAIGEHRLIMEELFDRPLKKWEVVHHLNGNKQDNRPENLFVMDRKEHSPRLIILPYQKRIKILEEIIKKEGLKLPIEETNE